MSDKVPLYMKVPKTLHDKFVAEAKVREVNISDVALESLKKGVDVKTHLKPLKTLTIVDDNERDRLKFSVTKAVEEAVSDVRVRVPDPLKKTHYVRPYEKYCQDCGKKNPTYDENDIKNCVDCDKPNSGDAKICWNCGKDDFEKDD